MIYNFRDQRSLRHLPDSIHIGPIGLCLDALISIFEDDGYVDRLGVPLTASPVCLNAMTVLDTFGDETDCFTALQGVLKMVADNDITDAVGRKINENEIYTMANEILHEAAADDIQHMR